ncbi:MAG: hypothetical protein PHE83_05905 [Opitutaceae bacterium]|nr:hypothetical protein [Opitutaceae bacterium]
MPELRYEIKVEGAGQAAGEFGRVGQAAEKAGQPQITFLGKLGEAQRAQQAAADAASKSLRDAGLAAGQANQVIGGLTRGGIGGLVTALRGLIGLIRGPFAAAMGSMGVVAAAIATPVLVAIKIMRDKFDENRQAMEDMWTGAAARADRYKQAIEQIDAAAQKMTADMLADLDSINDRMSEMEGTMGRADERSRTLGQARKEQAFAELELQRQDALTKAVTPEARQAIEEQYAQKKTGMENEYARNDLLNQQLDAKRDITNFSRTQAEARERARAARVQAVQARSEAENKIALAGDAARLHAEGVEEWNALRAKGEATPAALEKIQKRVGTLKNVEDLQEQARELVRKAELAEEAATKVEEGVAKTIAAAQQRIDKATLTLEQVPILQKTQQIKEQIQAKERINAPAASGGSSQIDALRKQAGGIDSEIGALQSALSASQGRFSILGGGGYNPERSEYESNLQAKMDQLIKTRDVTNSMLGDALTVQTRQERDTQKRLKKAEIANRNAGPGG